MSVPKTAEYKDIHGDMKIAPVTFDLAYDYLSQYGTEFDDSAVNLYKEKYLIYLRLCPTEDLYYIKSACRAAMKTQMVYEIDITFRKTGCVEEAQCECGAGQGPHGHCKHVRAVLYACCVFNKTGKIIVELTCTEKLQTFHKVKKFVGSPLKAKDLNMPGSDEISNFKDFDPRPPKFRKMESYPSYFYNTCMNFKGISKILMFQLFPPADSCAVAHDHDYLKETPEENFLHAFGVSQISDRECADIEFLTRGQNKNERWYEERTKRIQSSNFGRVCTATEKTDFTKLAESFSCVKTVRCDAILNGQKFEKEALGIYERDFDVKVKESGIFVSRTQPFLGASPDGVVDDKTLCEVKCPYSAKNKDISPITVPYLTLVDNKLRLKTSHQYFFQIQGQPFCSQREYCDFIVYTIKDIAYIRIQRDNDFISDMLEKLETFYTKHFRAVLLEKYFYKTFS